MVKKLFLIRHAQAEPASNVPTDFERRLTASGIRNAYLIGQYLKQEGVKPDGMISSTAVRAKLTVETIATQLEFDIEKVAYTDTIYEASVRELFELVSDLDDHLDVVFVVGHNPAITFLADYLANTALPGMKAASVAQINFQADSWSLLTKNSGEFINYYDQVD